MVSVYVERVRSLPASFSELCPNLTKPSDYNLAFMRAPDYARPSVARPSQDDSAFQSDTLWQPYPNQEPTVQINFGKFAHLQYDLHEIGVDIASFVFSESKYDIDAFHELDQRLAALSVRIPWPDEGTTLNPHIMDVKYVRSELGRSRDIGTDLS